MTAAPECEPRRRWFGPTPGSVVLGLLAVEGFLFLSERFEWFAFNRHKGCTADRRGDRRAGDGADVFVVIRRSRVSVAVPVQHPLVAPADRGCRGPVQLAGGGEGSGQKTAGSGRTKLRRPVGPSFIRDYQFDYRVEPFGLAQHLQSRSGQPGCGMSWEATCWRTLTNVYLPNSEVSDTRLEHLKRLPQLQVLNLNGTTAGDDEMEILKGLTQLRGLYLRDTVQKSAMPGWSAQGIDATPIAHPRPHQGQ